MKTTNTYKKSDIGKYLPWIGDKKMFAAVCFADKIAHQGKPICLALTISAHYYKIEQDKLAVLYSELVQNRKAPKPKQKKKIAESWQSKMTELEQIILA